MGRVGATVNFDSWISNAEDVISVLKKKKRHSSELNKILYSAFGHEETQRAPGSLQSKELTDRNELNVKI